SRFDFYFSMLMDVQNEGGIYADTRMEALMTLILTDTHTMRPDLFIPANQLSFLPIQDIMNELDDSFGEPFSLQDLAKKYHVSPGCLSSHFRRTVGISPMQYVTQSRMQRARLLLLNSELSINAIASQCGYPDVSNFVRRFHLQFQQTPLQYRQKHQ
ncbi:MAG: helix-turn-helix transcriptional regulator, partial [Clostridia bacterium]|nr:helix-turn-helix transcriptional regulator [Clostridia bacterium]